MLNKLVLTAYKLFHRFISLIFSIIMAQNRQLDSDNSTLTCSFQFETIKRSEMYMYCMYYVKVSQFCIHLLIFCRHLSNKLLKSILKHCRIASLPVKFYFFLSMELKSILTLSISLFLSFLQQAIQSHQFETIYFFLDFSYRRRWRASCHSIAGCIYQPSPARVFDIPSSLMESDDSISVKSCVLFF